MLDREIQPRLLAGLESDAELGACRNIQVRRLRIHAPVVRKLVHVDARAEARVEHHVLAELAAQVQRNAGAVAGFAVRVIDHGPETCRQQAVVALQAQAGHAVGLRREHRRDAEQLVIIELVQKARGHHLALEAEDPRTHERLHVVHDQ